MAYTSIIKQREFRQFGKLPGRPSALIRLALKDLAKVERATRQFKVEMSSWHFPNPNGKCSVCLAGAVMAKTMGTKNDRIVTPVSFRNEELALDALDSFRAGCIDMAFRCLRLDLPDLILPGVIITPYERSKISFRKDMFKMADELEGMGY